MYSNISTFAKIQLTKEFFKIFRFRYMFQKKILISHANLSSMFLFLNLSKNYKNSGMIDILNFFILCFIRNIDFFLQIF